MASMAMSTAGRMASADRQPASELARFLAPHVAAGSLLVNAAARAVMAHQTLPPTVQQATVALQYMSRHFFGEWCRSMERRCASLYRRAVDSGDPRVSGTGMLARRRTPRAASFPPAPRPQTPPPRCSVRAPTPPLLPRPRQLQPRALQRLGACTYCGGQRPRPQRPSQRPRLQAKPPQKRVRL